MADSEPSRLSKAANQLGQAWDVAITGKYRTHTTPMSWENRLSHIGHRLTDAAHCIFKGQSRVEAMHAGMARDLEDMFAEQETDDVLAPRNGQNKPPTSTF